MRKVGEFLKGAIGRDEVVKSGLIQGVVRDWEEIVGPEMAKRSSPDRVERGTIWVSVTGSGWAQELRMIKDTILQRIRKRLDDPSILLDIRFGVRPVTATPEKPALNHAVVEVFDDELTIRDIAERRLKAWNDEGNA